MSKKLLKAGGAILIFVLLGVVLVVVVSSNLPPRIIPPKKHVTLIALHRAGCAIKLGRWEDTKCVVLPITHDALKPCTDSSQCEGRCMAPEGSAFVSSDKLDPLNLTPIPTRPFPPPAGSVVGYCSVRPESFFRGPCWIRFVENGNIFYCME